MEIRHLRYFTELYRQRNFTKTAEQLFISQSALSQQISQLEGELGVTLFRRDRRSVIATPAADALYPSAEEVLASFWRFRSQAEQLAAGQKSTLKIILHNKLKVTRLVDLLGEFIAANPDITVDITDRVFPTAASVSPALFKEGDVAFLREMYCENLQSAPGYVCQCIVSQPICAVFSKESPLAEQSQVEFSDFQAHRMRMLGGQRGGLLNQIFTEMAMEDSDFAPVFTDDYDILAQLLRTGQYWTKSTPAFARYYGLACLPMVSCQVHPDPHRSDGVCMIYPVDSHRPGLDRLRAFIQKRAAQLEG